VSLEVSENDSGSKRDEASLHNWVMANQRMTAALKAKGYACRYVFAEAVGNTDGRVIRHTNRRLRARDVAVGQAVPHPVTGMATAALRLHLEALAWKVEMALDHDSHSWLLQVLQKIHVHFPGSAVPGARSPRARRQG
jgi:hypothetical protein